MDQGNYASFQFQVEPHLGTLIEWKTIVLMQKKDNRPNDQLFLPEWKRGINSQGPQIEFSLFLWYPIEDFLWNNLSPLSLLPFDRKVSNDTIVWFKQYK